MQQTMTCVGLDVHARSTQAAAVESVSGELIHIDVKKLGRIYQGAGKRITGLKRNPTPNQRQGMCLLAWGCRPIGPTRAPTAPATERTAASTLALVVQPPKTSLSPDTEPRSPSSTREPTVISTPSRPICTRNACAICA